MRSHLRAAAAVPILAVAAAMAPAAAVAQAAYAFDLPAQPLADSLRAVGSRAGVSVAFDPAITRGVPAPALKGTYSAHAALSQLAAAAGLSVRATGANAFLIVREAGRPQSGGSFGDVEPTDISELTVTGTRIRAAQAASPLISLGREDFAQAGAGSLPEVLRTLPQNFNGGPNEISGVLTSSRNGADQNLSFGSGVNLRGLGVESTLVLMNGRRIGVGGFGNFVDISAIPLSAVERVDVLTDGASAIYGSDAVGGVVNLILRDNIDGAETQLRYGWTPDGGLRQFSASQLFGRTWSSGSALINFDYANSDPLLTRDRPYAIGLQTGDVTLTPDDERYGVMINGHQDLSPSLRLSAIAYATFRDATALNWVTSQNRQFTRMSDGYQAGGTVSADWKVDDNWTVTLAQTFSESDVERLNSYAASVALPAQTTQVRLYNDARATEVEVEGALIRLPAGAMRLAAGLEHRYEELRVERVGLTAPFAAFDRKVSAGYAEVFVPIIGAENSSPGLRRFDVTAAYRYEDYSDVGAADTYKLGVVWSPSEGMNIRGTLGTSFRAPYLFQFDSSQSAAILAAAPFFPIPVGVIQGAPAPDLGPERAKTWTAGVDLDPAVFGFKVSATYYDIAYEDRIRAVPLAFNALTDPLLSTLVQRPPSAEILAAMQAAATFVNLTGTLPLSAAQAAFDGRVRNQGATKVRGLDVTVERAFDIGPSQFTAGANLNRIFVFKTALVKGAPEINTVDFVFNPADLRARGYLLWSMGPWSASSFVNYTDNYIDNQVATARTKVDSWTTVDFGLSYRFGAGVANGLTLRLNVVNAFDERPPTLIDRASAYGNPGFDTENANPLGRVVSVQFNKRW